MAPVDTPQIQLNPYTSTVPTVQFPQQDMQPGGPLPQQAGFMGKTGGIAQIGDQILKGFMRGRNQAALVKAQRADQTINLATKGEQDAYQTYQDSLRTGQSKPGDANDPAYAAYLQAHQAATAAMQKYAIPEEKPKGQKKQKPKDGEPPPMSFGEKLKDFMEANPHIVPQLGILARQPLKPVMTAQTEQTKNTLQEQGNQLTLQGQQIDAGKVKAQENQLKLSDQQQLRKVDELGGVDKVAADQNAPPELQAVARRAVSERLDKEGPDGQLRDRFANDVITGKSKDWTPADRQMAANLGYAAKPVEVKMTGKNGHEMQILVDPATNKPIPGATPLDLGPPQWAQEYYGERAAKQRDIRKAVQDNPEQYGVTLTGDKKTDASRVQAAAERIFVDHEEGIKSASGGTGRTAFEISRDNDILTDVTKQLKTMIPTDKKDNPGRANFQWPGQKDPVNLTHQDANTILGQFITGRDGEHPGVMTFRTKPQIVHGGPDAVAAAERDRQWAHDLVKNRMMAQKGKKAMTDQEAENILKQYAIGQPITASDVPAAPSDAPAGKKASMWDAVAPIFSPNTGGGKSNGFKNGPPTGPTSGATPGGKYYMAPGLDGPVQLSDEDVAKAKAQHIQLEEVSPDTLQQFQQ